MAKKKRKIVNNLFDETFEGVKFKSIGRRLSIIITIIVTVSFLSIMMVSYLKINSLIKNAVINFSKDLAYTKSMNFKAIYSNVVEKLFLIASSLDLDKKTIYEVSSELAKYKMAFEFCETLFIADEFGVAYTDTGKQFSIINRGYFKDIFDSQKMVAVSPVIISKDTGNRVVVVAIGIKDEKNHINKYLLGASLNMGIIEEIVKTLNINVGEEAWVFDNEGKLVYSPHKELIDELTIRNAHSDYDIKGLLELNKMLKVADRGEISIIWNGVKKIGYFSKIGDSGWVFLYLQDERNIFQYTWKAWLVTIPTSIVFLAFVGIFSSYILRRNLKPLTDFASKLNRMAKGDLVQEFNIKRNDEVGIMSESLKNLTVTLNDILDTIRKISNDLKINSEEVSRASYELSQRSQEQAASIEEISSTVSEFSNSLQNLSDKTNKTQELNRETYSKSQEMKEMMKKIHDYSLENLKRIDEIKNISDIVREVSFQTKLLSLNATIEAARAGEAGKGFAAVASEIRMLANQSSKHVSDIEKIIDNIVKSMETTMKLFGESYEYFDSLFSTFDEMSEDVDKIIKSIKDLSELIQQIVITLDQMSAVTVQNADMSEALSTSAKMLEEKSQQLSNVVSIFKISKKKGEEENEEKQ